MRRQTAVLGENVNMASRTADKSEVNSLFESDEIRQIDSATIREDEISQALDDDDAVGEEDQELEEEEEVEATARANQA